MCTFMSSFNAAKFTGVGSASSASSAAIASGSCWRLRQKPTNQCNIKSNNKPTSTIKNKVLDNMRLIKLVSLGCSASLPISGFSVGAAALVVSSVFSACTGVACETSVQSSTSVSASASVITSSSVCANNSYSDIELTIYTSQLVAVTLDSS